MFEKKDKDLYSHYPEHITICTTQVCNIKPPCIMCWKNIDPELGYINKDAVHIKDAVYEKTLTCLKNCKTLALHGIGEPLTYPKLFSNLNNIKIPEDTHIVFNSNGLLFNDKKINELFSINRKITINFSIDAANESIYRKIRHKSFNKLIGNIRKIVDIKERKDLQYPKLIINMCLMKENIHEMLDFVKLGQKIGVNAVDFFHLNTGNVSYEIDWFNYQKQLCHLYPEKHDKYMSKVFDFAAENKIKILAHPNDEENDFYIIFGGVSKLNTYENSIGSFNFFIKNNMLDDLRKRLKPEILKKIKQDDLREIIINYIELLLKNKKYPEVQNAIEKLSYILIKDIYLSNIINILKYKYNPEDIKSINKENISSLEKYSKENICDNKYLPFIYSLISDFYRKSDKNKYFIYKLKELLIKIEYFNSFENMQNLMNFLENRETKRRILEMELSFVSSNEAIFELQNKIQNLYKEHN